LFIALFAKFNPVFTARLVSPVPVKLFKNPGVDNAPTNEPNDPDLAA
jgi:hypothetical protein